MKKATVCLLIIIAVLLSNFVFAAIPASERAALIALYNSTNGDNWINNSGWKTAPLDTDGFAMPGTEENWYGVDLSGDHVGTIQLYYNDLSGSLPSQLSNLSNLGYLGLGFNQLSGSIPYQLGTLSNLQHICLMENQLSGGIPTELGNLSNLLYLGLYNNQLSGSIPSQLGNLTNLQYLLLSNNQLSGGIPSELGNLSNLQYLYLNGNELSGSIPIQLANLNNLHYFYLMDNQLSGIIPEQLANLNKLEAFNVGCNQLSGAIPEQLGNLTQLTALGLYNNQLSGGIPSQIGNLSQLNELILSYNKLSGSIPTSFTNLTKINILDISYNCLFATDSALIAWLDSHDLDWEVDQNECGTASVPSISTNSVRSITLTGAACGGKVTSTGGAPVISRGVCWSTSLDPTIADSKTIDGSGRGSFTSMITGLNPETDYYVRAYATNVKGTAYGSRVKFKTNSAGIPSITTNSVTSITTIGAVCGGNVTSTGGAPVTSRGVCWSTSLDPTIADSKTIDGSGTGSFSSTIKGLNPETDYYVRGYATNSKGTAYGSNISFATSSSPGIPGIGLSNTALNFGASVPGTVTGPQKVRISNTGSSVLNWSASCNAAWLSVTPPSGFGDSLMTVSVNPAGLTAGNYSEAIIITDPNASNSPQIITVSLHVYDQVQTAAPFGEFSAPLDGATVSGSITVTGWTVDDIGVANVKIYNGNAHIGEALFVEGARPDIEAAYPAYPNNYKAGWGYMLLTNCLPDGGNGTYTLNAKVTDLEGNEVSLGTKTITVDNAHAVKPFGALDSPFAGEPVSGKKSVNNGWVLTPQPNTIPFDGSTIDVVIDGVVKGHPVYNIFRSDLAALFPGYANTDGTGGYFSIDTTKLKNGLHTIAWLVSDSGGNSDGIGSRYFFVGNSRNSGVRGQDSGIREKRRDEPPCSPTFGLSSPFFAEIKIIEIKELERVEINLSDKGVVEGYLLVGDQLRELPIGSTLDRENGIFYWQPGPGFIGEYRFVFIQKDNDGQFTEKNIIVNIKPKQ